MQHTIQSNLSIWQVFKTVFFKIDNIVFSLTIRHIEIGRTHRYKPESDEKTEEKRNKYI